MSTPRAIVIRTAGTNCDSEMVRGFALAGAQVDLVHLDRLISQPARLDSYDLVGFAGGFSFGDDCGAGRVQAVQIRERLLATLRAMVERGVLMIGACNGFQVLVQTGLLPGPAPERSFDPADQSVSLATNGGGRFIDAWVPVQFEPSSICVWTRGLSDASEPPDAMMLPIAHGEGRFVARDDATLDALERSGQIVLRYQDNPNGSDRAIAGICDPTGRVLGLMPHPERYLSWRNHPFWTSLDRALFSHDPLGLRLFRNAVAAARRETVSI